MVKYLQHNLVGKAFKGNNDSLSLESFEINDENGGPYSDLLCINADCEL